MANEKFKNKFRIPSARATWHNYNAGTYFVTICTQNREQCFGEIITDNNEEPKMVLSEIGKFAEECIQKMETLHNDTNVPLWCIMPNHIHLIIKTNDTRMQNVETPYYDVSTKSSNIQTIKSFDHSRLKNEKMQSTANHCGRVSHIIARFKMTVTRFANAHSISFAWQPRFYDHIIRNTDELNRIATYIKNNIAQWESDKYHNLL